MGNLITRSSKGDRPSCRPPSRWLSRRDCIGLVCGVVLIVASVVASAYWSNSFYPPVLLIALFVIGVFIELPHVAFGSVVAVIFAIGCFLRWPPEMARLSPAMRGLSLLAVVFVLHGVWLQFGWMSFHPLCISGGGPFTLFGSYSLHGPMTPEAASSFVDILQRHYRDDAVQPSGTNYVLVRPGIALFDSSLHWNYTSRIAEHLDGAGASDDCELVEQAIMADGRAASWGRGWGYWPWNTFDEDGAFVQWLLSLHKD